MFNQSYLNFFIKTKKFNSKTYQCLVRNYHFIPYYFGTTKFSYIKELINEPNLILLVKGIQKRNILKLYTNNYIIDLEEYNCPKFSRLKPSTLTCCFSKHRNSHHCALKKVSQLTNWFKNASI